eukprot:78884-Prymnesium_polylepis.1
MMHTPLIVLTHRPGDTCRPVLMGRRTILRGTGGGDAWGSAGDGGGGAAVAGEGRACGGQGGTHGVRAEGARAGCGRVRERVAAAAA